MLIGAELRKVVRVLRGEVGKRDDEIVNRNHESFGSAREHRAASFRLHELRNAAAEACSLYPPRDRGQYSSSPWSRRMLLEKGPLELARIGRGHC
jgi:hypothetical protein